MSKRKLMHLLLEENEEEEILLQQLLKKKKAKVHPIFKTRVEEGVFNTLINRHLLKDDQKFREFFRLNIEQFNYVLDLVKEDLKKDPSNKHKSPITPDEKLAITLRFLATGESFKSLAFAFRISPSYISRQVQTTLSILRQKLVPIFLPPLPAEKLKIKSEEIGRTWNVLKCAEAIDGKHVLIFFPALSGSLYFNYKNFFSIVLLAIVDAKYKFIFVDVGSYGKVGDSGIFEKSDIGKRFRSGNMFPPPSKLPNCDTVLPHVFVGDEAFRLHTNMMKPFSRSVARADNNKAIFNYRLSQARRVPENAFALLSQVFRIFYTPIATKPETTDDLILVACSLHNLLRDAFLESQHTSYYELDPTEQPPSEKFFPLARSGGFANNDGFSVRDEFMNYFNSHAGTVPWQQVHVTRTH